MSKVGAKYIDDKDDKNNNTVPSEGPVPKAYECLQSSNYINASS